MPVAAAATADQRAFQWEPLLEWDLVLRHHFGICNLGADHVSFSHLLWPASPLRFLQAAYALRLLPGELPTTVLP